MATAIRTRMCYSDGSRQRASDIKVCEGIPNLLICVLHTWRVCITIAWFNGFPPRSLKRSLTFVAQSRGETLSGSLFSSWFNIPYKDGNSYFTIEKLKEKFNAFVYSNHHSPWRESR